MDKLTKILMYVVAGLLLLSILLTVRTCRQSDKIDEQTGLINSLNTKAKTWKDEQGKSHTKNTAVITENPKDFLNLKDQSEEIQKLQEQIKKYEKQIKKGGSVTNFTSTTAVTTTVPTKVDTVVVDNTKQLVYKSNFNKEGWVFGNVIASQDSTIINVGTKDEYTVAIGYDKTGFLGLGKPIPFSEITNHNKYSTTPYVKTYQVDVKSKRNTWVVPSAIALGLGVVGGILLTK
jgi:hypothetical protein